MMQSEHIQSHFHQAKHYPAVLKLIIFGAFCFLKQIHKEMKYCLTEKNSNSLGQQMNTEISIFCSKFHSQMKSW